MAEQQALPTWDEATASDNPAQKLPTWDEAVTKENQRADSKPTDFSPPVLSFMKDTGPGRIMSAFGHGFNESFDASHVGLSQDDLKSFHIDNETLDDLQGWHKKFAYGARDGLVMPSAFALSTALHAGGALFGATEEAIGQAGAETGISGAEKEAKFGFEGYAAGFPLGPRAALGISPKLPIPIAKARSAAVIGEGEGGYFGTTEPTPEQTFERHAASETIPQEIPQPEEPKPTPSIHEVARNMAPDTFREYDELTQKRETLGKWIPELVQKRQQEAEASAPHNDEISDLKAKIENASTRKAKIYQEKIDDLTAKNDSYIKQQTSKDNADLQRVRQEYQKVDFRMRDMAADVSKAYRDAQEHMPEVETVEKEPPKVEEATPTIVPEKAGEIEKAPEPLKLGGEPLKQNIDIASDVSKKLVEAGRPQEEAEAAAQLVKAHYEARAQRFGGKAGTAEEMYERDAANIRAGKDRDTSAGRRLNQKQSGYTKLATAKAKAIITLFKRADASTFIHESGHHWLDEMMRDEMSEHAPDDLKADAKTVREWIGAKEGEEIATKAHEKFARGFERYLMEGVAPSKQLAGVFAKFKEWLTNIYKVVENLKSPITDDIRHVFDRLLSTGNEKTIIADEYTPKAQEPEGSAVPVPMEEKPKNETPESTVKPLNKAPESTFVDKAGNIRLDNLNAPEDVKATLRALAQQNNNFLGARGGVITDMQRSNMADALGLTTKEFEARQPPDVLPEVWADAVQKLTFRSAEETRDASNKFAETGSIEDAAAWTEAIERQLMITNYFSKITASSGRTQRVFNKGDVSFLKDTAEAIESIQAANRGRTLNQMRDMAAKIARLDTKQKIAKFVNDSQKPSFGQMILEYWINGLISGPATHTTYIVGNKLLATWKAIPETAAAAVIGKAHEAMGHEASGIALGEVGAQLKGAVKGLPSAVAAAGKAIKTGVTTLLPGEEPRKLPFQPGAELVKPGQITNVQMNWREIGAGIFSAFKGIPDAFIAGDGIVRGNATLGIVKSHQGAIPDVAIGGKQIPVGSTIRVPGRAIAAIHSFFRTLNYSMEKSALAYRTAANEGLTGHDFDARVADIITNPSEEVMKSAIGTATDLTLMGKGGAFTQALSRLTNASATLPLLGETRLLKFIDPFVHISSNIIEQSILRRTPVGLLSADIRADLAGANGPAVRDFAQARMAVGTTLAVLGGTLAAQGLLSGSGPSGRAEAAAWRMAGNQPHSVKIGNTWYDIHRLGPLGMTLGISADMYEAAHAIGKEDATKVSSMLVHAIAQNILDESFMRGPSELMLALTDNDRYGASYVRNLAASFVPFSVGISQINRGIDPYMRQTRTVMDAIKAKIPYISQDLMPRRDIWGEPMENKEVLGLKGLSAIYETKINNDPVNQAILKIGKEFSWWPDQPERKIRGIKLTDQQYDDYSRLSGRMAKMRLNAIVNSPGFESIPTFMQYKFMKQAIETARETARTLVMMQNPHIHEQAYNNKLKLAGKNPSQVTE